MLPIIATAVGELASSIIHKFFPDESEAKKKELELQLQVLIAETDLAKGQVAVNTEEAKNDNLFVAGWRPAVGWICVLSMGYSYFVQPLLVFLLTSFGHSIVLPAFSNGDLMTILLGMLGLGSLRTFEKIKGVK